MIDSPWLAERPHLRAAVRVLHFAWPYLAFAIGVASYALIERTDKLAAWLVFTVFASWVWLLAEPWLKPMRGWRLSRRLARYATQAVHQETLFFGLPFLLRATDWGTGQALFTGTVAILCLVSLIDPLYFRYVCPHRWRFYAFHGLVAFLAMQAFAPVVFRLDTVSGYRLALATGFVVAAQGFIRLRWGWRRWGRIVLLLGAVAALWAIQPWVPPITLWMTSGAITQQFDRRQLHPGEVAVVLSPAQLQKGAYAYMALRAPAGLKEPVFHVWRHAGVEFERIPIEITGGREAGYRTWSFKRRFDADPAGYWTVTAETRGGQRIGRLGFEVRADP